MSKLKNQELIRKIKVTSATLTQPIETKPAFLYSFSKRLFDIAVSLLVTVFLLSWLLPILAILIKLDSKGSVFFLQQRIGAGGKPFYCIKLRSMVKNAMANVQQATTNDPRVTRVGKFLRYTYLDELPQFINVLLGQMSIVGPRPHMLTDCLTFSKVVPEYEIRHMIKPGITGLAQVKGYRGKVNSYFDITHRFKMDMFYIQKAGFILDIKIVFQTFTQVALSLNKVPQPKTPDFEMYMPTPRPAFKKVVAPLYQEFEPTERQSA